MSYRLARSTKKTNHHTRSAQPPHGHTPLHLRSNQRSGRRTAAQGTCNRPAVVRLFIFAKTSGQECKPPRRKRTTAPRLCAPWASRQSAVQHADPGPHVMQPACRLLGAEKSHRRLRQCRAPSGPSQKTEKISFQNWYSDSRHPAHGSTVILSAKVTGQSATGTGVTVGVAICGPVVIALTGVQEQQVDRQSDSGPTYRLASSLKAGSGATVSTLNQGYPLLQHEDAASVQHLKDTWRMAPNPTTWAGPRAPRGKER
jgi:hypothetical protein